MSPLFRVGNMRLASWWLRDNQCRSDLSFNECTIIADDGGFELLRFVKPSLFAAVAKCGEGIESRNRPRSILKQMEKASVAQFDHQISHINGRLRVQLAKYPLDELLIFLDFFRFDAVSDELF